VVVALEGRSGPVVMREIVIGGERILVPEGTTWVFDPVTGALQSRIEAHTGGPLCCAFSPDGARVATACDNLVKLWDAQTGALQKTLKGHTERVNGCAFSPDGACLVTASGDKTARVWNV
jgi:WD40 repeat protein